MTHKIDRYVDILPCDEHDIMLMCNGLIQNTSRENILDGLRYPYRSPTYSTHIDGRRTDRIGLSQ